ncbi:transposase, partial [Crocosphaera sp.]|uniref:transposase n=1 Tax=Crocosphaera sp. TaxID=2729996 RepID=UPI00257CE4B8
TPINLVDFSFMINVPRGLPKLLDCRRNRLRYHHHQGWKKPQKRGKNISIISALSLEKVLASSNIYGSVDGTTFEAFIVTKLVPELWENACVVLDNARIHLGEMVKEAIEEKGAKLIYLSPYSPEFSPIENFWSKVKAILRKLKARTYKDLIDGIVEAMAKVTQQDIRNWFTHCCYCTS